MAAVFGWRRLQAHHLTREPAAGDMLKILVQQCNRSSVLWTLAMTTPVVSVFRQTLFGALWTILAATSICAQQFPSIAGRQQDLDFITKQIASRHLNFFYQLDRDTFQQAAADLNARLANATDAE